MKSFIAAVVLLLPFLPAIASADDAWTPVQFLVGDWKGEGKAEDALGKGGTSFKWEVGHQLLVRRDHTEYAATADHPAFTYEALMVIYKNPASNQIEANYFDSGNHIIHYKLAPAFLANTAQFVSDAAGGPVFRLSYLLANSTDLTVKFELKPPGSDAFQTVAAGVVHKR